MRVEFKSVSDIHLTHEGDWVLEDDKIIYTGIFKKSNIYFSDIKKVELSIPETNMPPVITLYRKSDGKIFQLLYFRKKEPELSKGIEAFKYIKSKVDEPLNEQFQDKLSEQFQDKIKEYKMKNVIHTDEKLERLENKYWSYIKSYLSSLPKKGNYIISGAFSTEIANSCDELKEFYNHDKIQFNNLLQYLCNTKKCISKEDALGRGTKYALSSQLEQEPNITVNKSLAIKILAGLKDKYKEYTEGCNNDQELIDVYQKFLSLWNKYSSAVLNTQLHIKKPMSPTSSAIVGTAIGGSSIGALAALNSQQKLKKHYENERECISSQVESDSLFTQLEFYFYKVQSILYLYEGVYEDWLNTKDKIINS